MAFCRIPALCRISRHSEDSAIDKRVAIVTGASRGIGRAIAERLARDGRHVVLVARSAEGLAAVKTAIDAAGGSCEVRPCDIGDGAALNALVEAVAEMHGRLDILVNNAGITRDTLLLRMTDEQWDEVITVNLRSVFVACRAAIRPMMRGRFGRIINLGSVSGITGNAGQANYAASKAALIGFTKTIAKEMGAKDRARIHRNRYDRSARRSREGCGAAQHSGAPTGQARRDCFGGFVSEQRRSGLPHGADHCG